MLIVSIEKWTEISLENKEICIHSSINGILFWQ